MSIQHLTGPVCSYSHPGVRPPQPRTGGGVWRRSAVVWSFKAELLRRASVWATSPRVVIRSLLYSAGSSDQGHFPDDFRTAAYDHVRTLLLPGRTSPPAAVAVAAAAAQRYDQQNYRGLALKLAFCGSWNLTSLQHRPRSVGWSCNGNGTWFLKTVIGFDILAFNTFSIFIHTRTAQASVLTHNSVKRLVVAAVTLPISGIGTRYQYQWRCKISVSVVSVNSGIGRLSL